VQKAQDPALKLSSNINDEFEGERNLGNTGNANDFAMNSFEPGSDNSTKNKVNN
jgi:hypothetical protein